MSNIEASVVLNNGSILNGTSLPGGQSFVTNQSSMNTPQFDQTVYQLRNNNSSNNLTSVNSTSSLMPLSNLVHNPTNLPNSTPATATHIITNSDFILHQQQQQQQQQITENNTQSNYMSSSNLVNLNPSETAATYMVTPGINNYSRGV